MLALKSPGFEHDIATLETEYWQVYLAKVQNCNESPINKTENDLKYMTARSTH